MSEPAPLISVIITAYNREELVGRAINSALVQTYRNIEIILVDDASIDGTIAVVKAINNPLIRIIENAKNLGASGAKNVGVDNASGEYIAFLDSDDVWYKNKLEVQYNALNKSPNSSLSFTATMVHRNNDNKVVIRAAQRKNSWYESIMYAETFSLGSTLLASKECFNKVGKIDESLIRFEDRDWCLRYFDYYSDFIYISEPLVDIYNSSGWPSAKTVRDSANIILKNNKEKIKEHSEKYYKIFSRSMEFEVAVARFRSGQKIQATMMIIKTFFINYHFAKHILYRIFKKIKQLDFF